MLLISEMDIDVISSVMNSISLWIGRKLKRAGIGNCCSKKGKHRLAPVQEIFFTDQHLYEATFFDKAVISVYNFNTDCNICSDEKCLHIKAISKLHGVSFDKYSFLKNLRRANGLKMETDADSDSESGDEGGDDRCPICFVKLASITRIVSCPCCSQTLHKACWVHWKTTRNSSSSTSKYTCADECVVCRAEFSPEDNLGLSV